jgi:hypothetical protein
MSSRLGRRVLSLPDPRHQEESFSCSSSLSSSFSSILSVFMHILSFPTLPPPHSISFTFSLNLPILILILLFYSASPSYFSSYIISSSLSPFLFPVIPIFIFPTPYTFIALTSSSCVLRVIHFTTLIVARLFSAEWQDDGRMMN